LDFIKNSTLKTIADESANAARPYIDEVEAFFLSGTTPIVDASIADLQQVLFSENPKSCGRGIVKFMYDVNYL